MDSILGQLHVVGLHVRRAISIAEEDRGASPVLVAVLLELERVLDKARGLLTDSPSAAAARECVVEIEQAADSANVAAKADVGASSDTRLAVDFAHTSIALIKKDGLRPA
jgi:hypothetical protein